jgi:hypothetical protein
MAGLLARSCDAPSRFWQWQNASHFYLEHTATGIAPFAQGFGFPFNYKL